MPDQLPSQQPEFAAFVGLDWGDRYHHWALQPADASRPTDRGRLDNTPEAIELWVAQLTHRFPGGHIAVALEQQRGAVVNMLSRYPCLLLFAVPPTMSAAYRQAFRPSGAKSDPGDTALLLELVTCHRDRLLRHAPDTDDTRLLQLLVEERRHTVDEKTAVVQRLTDCLKQYFPHLLRWFATVDSPLVADLLERWPTLEDLRRTNPSKLRDFLHKHNCRKPERIQQQIDDIYAAVPATLDAAVLEARSRRALGLVKLLRALWPTISELNARIRELTARHPDAPIFASFPGAGAATVPRLIAAFGADRDRFESSYRMRCLTGIAPVQKASGKTSVTVYRVACPKFLRQTFHEFAGQSIRFCSWAKAFYRQKRDRGAPHHVAVRALAAKWLPILFRCWKEHQPYDEQRYLNSLRRRRALLGRSLSQTTAPQWKTVAGFQKLSIDLP
jgi:transposase